MRAFSTLNSGIAAAIGLAALAVSGSATADTVLCHDPKRDIVIRMPDHACNDRVVSGDEAAAIAKRRADYVRRAVNAEPPPRPDGIGSGIFVSRNGHVLTNRHVVENCRKVSVLEPGGNTVAATLLSVSSLYDLALLRTGSRPDAVAVIADPPLKKGEAVTITGFPVRKLPRVQPLEITGRYLGKQRSEAADGILVLDAKVWLGSSGSPIVTASGKVAGLVFARNAGTKQRTATTEKATPVSPERTYAVTAGSIIAFLKNRDITPATDAATARAGAYTVRVDCHS